MPIHNPTGYKGAIHTASITDPYAKGSYRELGGFDPQFVISADYALFLKLSLLSDPVIVDFPIAQFMTGGASTDQWRKSFAEFHTARCLILKPSGLDAVREKFWTQWHFSRVWIYRELIARARR